MNHPLIRAILLMTVLAAPAEAASPSASQQRGPAYQVRPFLESALLGGWETRTPDYRESNLRLHTELGVGAHRLRGGDPPSWSLAVFASATPGASDIRGSLGARVTCPLSPRLGLQVATGPLWSSRDGGAGFQARLGLVYRERASLVAMWQRLSYDNPGATEDNIIHSTYAGIMLHGRWGGYFTLASWAAIAVVASLALGELAGQLRGLN